jgi:hypothetical protein
MIRLWSLIESAKLSMSYRGKGIHFIINKAINDMLSRTLITSGTVFVSALCLYLFAGGTVGDIAFAICVGSRFWNLFFNICGCTFDSDNVEKRSVQATA